MSAQEPKNPRVILEEDHRRIDAMLDRLVATVRSDDRDGGAKQWTRVEKALLAHFDVEEMFVLPVLGEEHAVEVEGIRREHAALRSDMGTIGLAFELHTIRAEQIESFCTRLRAHADRESALAYLQAERKMQVSTVRSVIARLKGAVALAVHKERS